MNEQEKTKIRLDLMEAMGIIVEELPEDHHIGFFPENIQTLMADAALNVLETVYAVNVYFEEQVITRP